MIIRIHLVTKFIHGIYGYIQLAAQNALGFPKSRRQFCKTDISNDHYVDVAGRVFASEQGLIFNAIRPDKVMDFETVLAKLRAALADSKDPVRNQQGWGWKIFKAAEPGPNGSVLYVFVMDPAVKGADYGVAKILSEAYPNEIMELYRMYTGAFATAGQTLINLQPSPALAPSSAPASDGGAPGGAAPSPAAPAKP